MLKSILNVCDLINVCLQSLKMKIPIFVGFQQHMALLEMFFFFDFLLHLFVFVCICCICLYLLYSPAAQGSVASAPPPTAPPIAPPPAAAAAGEKSRVIIFARKGDHHHHHSPVSRETSFQLETCVESDLIYVTNITNYIRGEKIVKYRNFSFPCMTIVGKLKISPHVGKFQYN